MNEQKCKDCKWVEFHERQYICGYIAELYNIASKIELDAPCKLKNERMNEMDKHQEFMRKFALLSNDDSFVSIPKAEYEALLRESETLRTITELFRRNTFLPEYTVRVILGLGGENPDIVTPGRFEKEPPKEKN